MRSYSPLISFVKITEQSAYARGYRSRHDLTGLRSLPDFLRYNKQFGAPGTSPTACGQSHAAEDSGLC